MKGRGTRKHNFLYQETGESAEKKEFLLLDFFGNCKYFEEDFDYDKKLKLPISKSGKTTIIDIEDPKIIDVIDKSDKVDAEVQDAIATETKIYIGEEGMKIDRSLYPHQQFEQVIQESETLQKVQKEQGIECLEEFINVQVFNKPTEYWNAEKIRQSYEKEYNTKRKISLTEMILKALGRQDRFKSREERVKEEFEKFIDIQRPVVDEDEVHKSHLLKTFFETYVSDFTFRDIVDNGRYADLSVYPSFSMNDLQTLNGAIDDVKIYVGEYLQKEMAEFAWR
jgi:type I restriction enzyme R subunit